MIKRKEGLPSTIGRTDAKAPGARKNEALIEEKKWTVGAIVIRIAGERYTVTPPEIENEDPLALEKLDKIITNLEELDRIIKKTKARIAASANNKDEILKIRESLVHRGYTIIPDDEKALEYAVIQDEFEKYLKEEEKE